jgi:hypothetical protein
MSTLPKLSAQSDSEETVLTPVGNRPISKVHRIPLGGRLAHVGNEIHLIDRYNNVINKVIPEDTKPRVPEETGWVAFAYWYYDGSPPIQDFRTTWTVPPNPTTNNGQTVFLFNSIEPANFHAIIQPVLQWGPSAAGGGTYWSIAGWYLIGDVAFSTSLSDVSVGDSLEAVISLTAYSDTSFDYQCSFSGISGTLLKVTGVPELVYATETLEAYSIVESSDYPTGSTSFNNIFLTLTDSTFPTLAWSTSSDADNGLTTTVDIDGSNDGEVTVHYPS